jgi:drug/metabolite transporter (DMT)-like permease
MAIKRNSPLNGRSPSILRPVIDVEDASFTHLVVESGDHKGSWVLSMLRSPSGGTKPKYTTKSGGLLQQIPVDLVIAMLAWYIPGVGSICTTKILLMDEYALPPLVLTFQQLFLGSSLLRLYLGITGGVQPLPKENKQHQYSIYYDFVLMGLFNALDFLASNTCFAHSAASFVETIKASEPLTTTAIALFFGIDKLYFPEAMSMAVLIIGVFFSTLGNAESDEQQLSVHESVKTCVIVMTANICFALRAKSQKLFRANQEGPPMNDANLLMRLQQVGAMSLLVPLVVFELPGVLQRTLDTPWEKHGHFWVLAIVNAACFGTYSLASCYVLSKLSVVQHTGLGCLRRMFAILFTSLVFGVPITPLGALGIVLCFCGFCSFSHFRYMASSSLKPQMTSTPRTTL